MQDRYDRVRHDLRASRRPDDDRERPDHPYDEDRSWSRAPDAPRRREGYGQYAREVRDDEARRRGAPDDYDYGGPTYGRPRGAYRDENCDDVRGADGWNADDARRRPYRSFGPDDATYGAATRSGERYLAGSPSRPRDDDYDPDYLHWREQQLNRFDRDYDDWRSERRERFSSEFDTWRSQRNAIVENVADGGTGSQKDIKSE